MAANLKNNKHIENIKKGFQDIQTVSQEGNFKLFLKQAITILVVFLAFRYANGEFNKKLSNIKGQRDAIKVQKSSEREYLQNKEKLIMLEPRFPDVSAKNEWLLSQVLSIFKEANLTPAVSGTQTEDASNSNYTLVSLGVSTDTSWSTFANFLAGIENRTDLIRVSEFSLTKDTNPENLALNKISMKINTVFPKEKVGKSIFKDYDKLVAEQKAKESGKTEGNAPKGGK